MAQTAATVTTESSYLEADTAVAVTAIVSWCGSTIFGAATVPTDTTLTHVAKVCLCFTRVDS
jgi:hypothetical protein